MTRPAPPVRTVVVLRDVASPVWFLRCAVPCGGNGADWCMGINTPGYTGPPMCWLGGYLTKQSATETAKRLGYELRDEGTTA